MYVYKNIHVGSGVLPTMLVTRFFNEYQLCCFRCDEPAFLRCEIVEIVPDTLGRLNR